MITINSITVVICNVFFFLFPHCLSLPPVSPGHRYSLVNLHPPVITSYTSMSSVQVSQSVYTEAFTSNTFSTRWPFVTNESLGSWQALHHTNATSARWSNMHNRFFLQTGVACESIWPYSLFGNFCCYQNIT